MKRLFLVALLLGCSSKEETRTAVQRGEALASDPGFSGSAYNAFSCTTCHAVATSTRVLPGAPLGGAVKRPTFWNGRFLTIGDAVDECVQKFMRGKPLDRGDARWIDLWAYLESIGDAGPKDARPFDVVLSIADLPRGDATRGEGVWTSTCATCHGAPKTGEGRLQTPAGTTPASLVPNDTIAVHGVDGPDVVRQVVIEKIRHGSFLGFAGTMPPFSKQALSDAQVADVVTYLGLY